jgi:hypothetical protein
MYNFWTKKAVKFWTDAGFRASIEADASAGDREANGVMATAYALAAECVSKVYSS